jgi:hypothetical protein
MVEAVLQHDLNFPAEQVWAVMGDFGNMAWTGAPDWEVIGEGVGMTRRVLMEGMDPIDEVLESLDNEAMSFAYTIPRGLPLPVDEYRSEARVEALDADHCRVHWSCTCVPRGEGMSAADVQALMEQTYGGMLAGLEQYLDKLS